jgi:transketolase N-terminal domain/subunit
MMMKNDGTTPMDPAALREAARAVRLDVLETTARMGGHPTSCFSAVEILTVIYLGGCFATGPGNPPGRIGTASS